MRPHRHVRLECRPLRRMEHQRITIGQRLDLDGGTEFIAAQGFKEAKRHDVEVHIDGGHRGPGPTPISRSNCFSCSSSAVDR